MCGWLNEWCQPDHSPGGHLCQGTGPGRLLGLQHPPAPLLHTYWDAKFYLIIKSVSRCQLLHHQSAWHGEPTWHHQWLGQCHLSLRARHQVRGHQVKGTRAQKYYQEFITEIRYLFYTKETLFSLRYKCGEEGKMFRHSLNGSFFPWMEARCGSDRMWKYDPVSSWEPCVSYACPRIPWPAEDKHYQASYAGVLHWQKLTLTSSRTWPLRYLILFVRISIKARMLLKQCKAPSHASR